MDLLQDVFLRAWTCHHTLLSSCATRCDPWSSIRGAARFPSSGGERPR